MREQAKQNKIAWEYRAYEFSKKQGSPKEIAEQLKVDPLSKLKLHQKYFKSIHGMKIANVCESNIKAFLKKKNIVLFLTVL